MAVCRFCLEGLELRQLLSGVPGDILNVTGSIPPLGVVNSPSSALGILAQPAATPVANAAQPETSAVQALITTVPASGAQLTQSPTSLVVTFNQQDNIGQDWWQDGNVQLEQINSDGTTTQLFDPNAPPIASFDSSGTQATIPLDQTLTPGHYQIVLVGDYVGSDGSGLSTFLSDGGALWDPSQDLVLADFTVVPKPVVPAGVTFNDASDLGIITSPVDISQVQTSSGSLDLAAAQTYALYKVTLGPGHFWRLGVELDAERIGSSLLGALTLFDQQGDVLTTRDSGTGLPSSPDDPYLFAGLNPGVYYIGVSGAGNLPGQPGGYDPGTGTIGTAGEAQAGGSYNLQIVADPADSLTQLTGFSLQRADPLDPTPTGLTLTFSGALDPNSLMSNSPVLVHDASGKAWPVTLSSYEGSQMSFVFNQPLPPGQYTVAVPPSGGLTDFTGRAPVSPGPTPGVLATFTVKSETSSSVAGNLGIVWPSLQSGVSQFATIAPGQTVVSRVVVLIQGQYKLNTSFTVGSAAITRIGPGGFNVVDPASSGPPQTYSGLLNEGVYFFEFSAVGSQSVQGSWTFRPVTVDFDNAIQDYLVSNGVGQSPALALRLTTPMSSGSTLDSPPATGPMLSGDVTPISSPTNPQSGTVIVSVPTSGASGGPVSATGLAPIPASLLVTVNTGLLGSPTVQNEQIGVVGPVVAGGSIALAGSFPGLPPGIFLGSSGSLDQRAPKQTDAGPVAGNSSATDAELAESGSSSSATPGVILASASSADAQALTRADRITELAGRLGRWFGLKTGQEGATVDGALAESDLLARNEREPGRGPADGSAESSTERMAEADLGMPTGLIVAAALAYRLRQLAGRWWRRTRGQVRAPSRPEARPPGPSSRSFRGSHGSHAGATCVRTSHRR